VQEHLEDHEEDVDDDDDDYEDEEEEEEEEEEEVVNSKNPKGLNELIKETKEKSDKKLAKIKDKSSMPTSSGLSSVLKESLAKEKKANMENKTKLPSSPPGLHSVIAETMNKEKKMNKQEERSDEQRSDFGDTEDEADLSKAYEKHIEDKEKHEEVAPQPPIKTSFKDLIKNKKNESSKLPVIQKKEPEDGEHEDGEEVFERGASKNQSSPQSKAPISQSDKEFHVIHSSQIMFI
jgi:hypothetical protein